MIQYRGFKYRQLQIGILYFNRQLRNSFITADVILSFAEIWARYSYFKELNEINIMKREIDNVI